jgi:ABC-type Zn uptake system ZnuABC Zn-binding protein ZnuA
LAFARSAARNKWDQMSHSLNPFSLTDAQLLRAWKTKLMSSRRVLMVIFTVFVTACQPSVLPPTTQRPIKVLAVETFLADITQNVAGDRLQVQSLLPIGVDPHAFEPTPGDVTRITDSPVIVVNGAGVEGWLQKTLENAGGKHAIITASNGLPKRNPGPGEIMDDPLGDPHFWLDPVSVIHYVENIRDGLIQADPAGKQIYTRNADVYIAQLKDLDSWIKTQVAQIPPEQRLLVTNHESLGYFADRYGFKVVGSVIPSVSSEASPSAQQMADLVGRIRQSGAKAIFIEKGSNIQLADQVARETNSKVIDNLLTHSITDPHGSAPTYIEMMKYNTQTILDALK